MLCVVGFDCSPPLPSLLCRRLFFVVASLPCVQSKAALTVYEAILKEGTQKSVVPIMQTRAELYESEHAHTTRRPNHARDPVSVS